MTVLWEAWPWSDCPHSTPLCELTAALTSRYRCCTFIAPYTPGTNVSANLRSWVYHHLCASQMLLIDFMPSSRPCVATLVSCYQVWWIAQIQEVQHPGTLPVTLRIYTGRRSLGSNRCTMYDTSIDVWYIEWCILLYFLSCTTIISYDYYSIAHLAINGSNQQTIKLLQNTPNYEISWIKFIKLWLGSCLEHY